MDNLNEIYWHDSEIESVIEIPAKDKLIYNVQYPENWNQNIFLPKAIIFDGYGSHSVEEIPFAGNPTILSADLVKSENGFFTVKLETNAGIRHITAKSVTVEVRSFNI